MYYTKGGEPKSSYDEFIFAVEDFFWPMESKHCNTDKKKCVDCKGDYFEK